MPSKGPVLVRHTESAAFHPEPKRSLLWVVRVLLLLAGLGFLGYYGYALSNQYVYQKYENWAFDQQISGRAPVSFLEYLREKTPLASVLGRNGTPSAPINRPDSESRLAPPPDPGSILGRVEVPRLHLAAMVREGVDTDTLSKAVGHVPTTALAGQIGNFAIAAHRDTLFRGLKDIQKGDVVTFQSAHGVFSYRIFSLRVVKPSEVSVLRPDGGVSRVSPVQDVTYHPNGAKLITLITCYPFFYVGSAPNRFIVQGQLISSSTSLAPHTAAIVPSPPKRRPSPKVARAHDKLKQQPRSARGFSHLRDVSSERKQPVKKKNFWKRLLHIS